MKLSRALHNTITRYVDNFIYVISQSMIEESTALPSSLTKTYLPLGLWLRISVPRCTIAHAVGVPVSRH